MKGGKRTARVLELEHIDLPPEIWRQILGRLPPKTLMQFRCVCKNWRSLIDDSDFISMHFNLYTNCHANTQLLLTVEVGQNSSASQPLTFTLRRSDTFRKICQFCKYSHSYVYHGSPLVNGLLLFLKSGYLTLLNPSIRKSLTLPSCPLARQLKRSPFGFSRFLGYAPSSGDYYKVVVLDKSKVMPFGLTVVIYSLRDHCWTEHEMQVPQWAFEFMQWGYGFVYSNGAAYWRPSPSRANANDPELVFFDFDSLEFRYLKLPDVEEGMRILLFVFSGSLAVFGISGIRSCIWVLENNAGNEQWRECWNGDTNLDVYELVKDLTPFSLSRCQIRYIEDSGTLLLNKSEKLVAYNIRTNQAQPVLTSISFSYVDFFCGELGVAQRIRKCWTTVQNCRCRMMEALMYVVVPMPCMFFGGGSTQFLVTRDGGGCLIYGCVV